MEFIKIDGERRKGIINEAAARIGIPSEAVEKDWWVTQTLRAISESTVREGLIFKGGTSLSKGWGLIRRFSEDIDLAMDRKIVGVDKTDQEITRSQIERLREKCGEYTNTTLKDEIHAKLIQFGIPEEEFEIIAMQGKSNQDPATLIIKYTSLFPENQYIKPQVKIEVSARSKIEPNEIVEIKSMIKEIYSEQSFADTPFKIKTALPQKTIIEKCLLLHEIFIGKQPSAAEYKSRHLSDLVNLMDTEHGKQAVENHELFYATVEHRKQFNEIKDLDYSKHTFDGIDFIPPDAVIESWKDDYEKLRENMIPGEAISFDQLIGNLREFIGRFRAKGESMNGENSPVQA
jgi:hypothetical protein